MSHTPSSAHTALAGTRLCTGCEKMRINDKACGGFVRMHDAETPVLAFPKESVNGWRAGVLKLLMGQERDELLPGFSHLARSAAAGCQFCRFIHSSFLQASRSIKGLQIHGRATLRMAYHWGRRFVLDDRDGLQAFVAIVFGPDGKKAAALHFGIYAAHPGPDEATDWLFLHNPPLTQSLCPENIEFLQDSLESCTTDCHPLAQSSFLPTRLLDLGVDDTATPRLIITADSLNQATPLRYAALSYSWGNEAAAATQTKTEKSNFHERLQGIPPHDMSAVLRDAVQVCRSMSVRYLWIDALCIIQDRADPSDWERESASVGQVYQNAYFTICAVSTSNCHESFLARSQHTFELDFQSSINPSIRGKYALHYTGVYDGTPNHDPISNDLRFSPWNDRGWVFQEQELSAPKILFGHHMVHFQCSTSEESENGEVFSPPVPIDWFDLLDRKQVYDYFRETTQVYAARLLSYESDRLPALGGLAQRVFKYTGSQYLAGLWEEDLHLGLLWSIPPTGQTLAERLATLRASTGSGAPSWSWMSQQGRIEYSGPFFRHFTIQRRVRKEYSEMEASTILKGARLNQFGDVASGRICVRGKVFDVPKDSMLETYDDGQNRLWRGSKDRAVKLSYFYTDWVPTQNPWDGLRMLLLSSGCGRAQDKRLKGGEDDKEEHHDSESEDSGDDVASKRGGQAKAQSKAEAEGADTASSDGRVCDVCNGPEHGRDAGGLILHSAETPGEYYRVGVFDSRADEGGGTQLFERLGEEWISII